MSAPRLFLATLYLSFLAMPSLASAQAASASASARERSAQAHVLAVQMVGSPEYTTTLRSNFEAEVKTQLDKGDPASSDSPQSELTDHIAAAMGKAYEGEMRALIEVPIAAATTSFSAHMQKYELDRLVEFLSTSGGRKFIVLTFSSAADLRSGKIDTETLGAKLLAQFSEAELADFTAAMEPEVVAHWREALLEFKPAASAWMAKVSTRSEPKFEAVAKHAASDFYKNAEAKK